MVIKTLCRAYANGVEFKVVRVHWDGRGGGYTYRVYRNRRRFDREDYIMCQFAFACMRGALLYQVESADLEDKL